MNRRGLLGATLAAFTAPAYVRRESLGGLWVPAPMPAFVHDVWLKNSLSTLTLVAPPQTFGKPRVVVRRPGLPDLHVGRLGSDWQATGEQIGIGHIQVLEFA